MKTWLYIIEFKINTSHFTLNNFREKQTYNQVIVTSKSLDNIGIDSMALHNSLSERWVHKVRWFILVYVNYDVSCASLFIQKPIIRSKNPEL